MLTSLLWWDVAQAQDYDQKLLFHENFETKTTETQLNVAWDKLVRGNNRWIVNKDYLGKSPDIPDFVLQDKTSGGTISEPNSNYLHVVDLTNIPVSGKRNAYFDPTNNSETFTLLGDGFCTLDMDKITVAFFWCLPKENADAYAEVYYNTGGAWNLLTSEDGRSKISGSPSGLWKYEKYSNVDMANKQNVQVGIRWFNKKNTSPKFQSSIGIDDIFIVGLREKRKKPVEITIETGNEACQNGGINVTIKHSVPVCDGEYEIQLSNDAGNFNTYSVLRTLTIFAASTGQPFATGANIPSNITPGSGYRIRVVRKSGYPPNEVISEISLLDITIKICPNDITTLEPPIANMFDEVEIPDPNRPGETIKVKRISICKGSVIDVPFLSKYVYLNDNFYVCEISDVDGKFGADLGTNKELNRIPDPNMHPSKPMAGVISGLIPDDVPVGCNYYFRVRSTNPEIIGTVWGPFCIRECDMETNNRKDITLCLKDWEGCNDTLDKEGLCGRDTLLKIPIKIHKWADSNYYPVEELNKKTKFRFQVWKYTVPFSIKDSISEGLIGEQEMNSQANFKIEEFDPISNKITLVDTLILRIPKYDSIAEYDSLKRVKLFPPGTYYIRVIATAPNDIIDTLGTLVRLTIGLPFKKGPLLIDLQPGKKYCADELMLILFNVRNRVYLDKKSQYAWYFIPVRSDSAITEGFLDTLSTAVDSFQVRPSIITDPGQSPWREAEKEVLQNAGWYLNPSNGMDYVIVYVRELSAGICWAPPSNPVVIPIIRLPTAEFDGMAQACAGDTVTYTVGFIQDTYYEWSIKGLDENNKDGFETFINERANNQYKILFKKPGNYLVSNATINKCGQQFIDVPVLVKTPPQIDSLIDVVTCKGELFTIEPKMVIPPAPAGMNYLYTWYDLDHNVVSSSDSPKLTMLAEKNQTFVLEIKDVDSWPDPNACYAVDTVELKVPSLDGAVGVGQTICINKSVTLSATGGDTYLWTGDDSISDPASPNPTVSPKVTTTYSVIISKMFPELNNTVCSQAEKVEVKVMEEPNVSKLIQFCKGGRVILDAKNIGATYEWYEMIDSANQKLVSKSRTLIVRKAGKFKVLINNPDTANKCFFAVDFQTIMIESKKESVMAGDCKVGSIKLTSSVDSAFYRWSNDAVTKSIVPGKAGVYTVTATNMTDSCQITELFTVELDPKCNDFVIDIPNAFSPNVTGAANSGNEYWHIWVKDLVSYKVAVYDRWGHQVFLDQRSGLASFETHTENEAVKANDYSGEVITDHAIKWDGKFKGEWVTEGVYVYVLEGVTTTKKPVSFVGTITVVR